ncbi:MAG: YkgJ family cysteine cluster protein [Deltaproteobacteria bacterium]|nr:MAG: YkgJ family cysteine cluster protein [Deltaproteobacteria bacterium]
MATDDLVPPLRAGVRLLPRTDAEGALLEDAILGRRIRLDGRGRDVALALDGPQPLAALAERLGGEPEPIAKAVAFFARLHLLDTDEARALAADAVALDEIERAAPASVPLLVREDARFTCTMCGSCCGGHNVGPVFEDILDGLAPHAADLEAATRTAKGLFFTMGAHPEAPDQAQVLCHQTRGSCIFLMDDRRCRIHADLGGDKKPRACRIFPYELVATPRGVAVTIQRECRGFLEARSGKRLVDDTAALREVIALAPRLSAVRRIISLAPGRPLSWDDYQALEDALHEAVDRRPDDACGALSAARDVLVAALGEDPGARPPRTDVPALSADLDALVAGLLERVEAMRGAVPPPSDEVWVRAEALDHLRDALTNLRADLPRAVAPLARPDQRELFAEHLHHGLMSKALAMAPTVLAGWARLSFGWLVTMTLAIHRARQVKRRHLVAQDVMDALVITSFLWRHDDIAERVLPAFDEALVDLFVLRWPALVAAARDLPDPDRRLELVKF